MKVEKDWSDYYKATKAKPPHPLLVRALEYVAHKDTAIDIGGGALNDSKYLLKQGFDVTVIDKSPLLEDQAKGLNNKKLHAMVTSFEDFGFPENEYDLACAMFALPFTNPQHFDAVFRKIKDSLKKGGVFCGQLFGINDEWSKNPKMSFHTREQVENFFKDLEVISTKEVEENGPTATGPSKHWHVFHIIAKK
jgi:tellurite methyltransferase